MSRSLDEVALHRVVAALAVRGLDAAPALILFRLAILGARRRDLYDVTADQLVWEASAVLRHVPRPRVGIRLRSGSADVIYFSGEYGAWIAKRARVVERGASIFPLSAFRALADALDAEKTSWYSMRLRAAYELLHRRAA